MEDGQRAAFFQERVEVGQSIAPFHEQAQELGLEADAALVQFGPTRGRSSPFSIPKARYKAVNSSPTTKSL